VRHQIRAYDLPKDATKEQQQLLEAFCDYQLGPSSKLGRHQEANRCVEPLKSFDLRIAYRFSIQSSRVPHFGQKYENWFEKRGRKILVIDKESSF
jgi:hypothetical protein